MTGDDYLKKVVVQVKPDVINPVRRVDNAVKVGDDLDQHVHQRFAKANEVHGDGDGVGQGEHEPNGTSKLGSQRPASETHHTNDHLINVNCNSIHLLIM